MVSIFYVTNDKGEINMRLDLDELYMEYEDLITAGEIDPKKVSIEQYIEDRISSLIDDAHDRMDMER
jgi:hypothetical protein